MTTKVSAGALLSQLRTNLEKHEKDHAEALEGWKRKMRVRLDEIVLQLDDEDFNLHKLGELRRPETHKSDYEQAIAMLELRNSEDEIELGWDQFRQFWQDDWDWKQHFIASNSAYLN